MTSAQGNLATHVTDIKIQGTAIQITYNQTYPDDPAQNKTGEIIALNFVTPTEVTLHGDPFYSGSRITTLKKQ